MLKTNKYVFNNYYAKITVLSKLDTIALRTCNKAMLRKNKSYQLFTMHNLESKEESSEELTVENARLLLCEWKRD